MTEQIKAHLDSLLQGAPMTRRVEEMRQELLAGCLDKYADLTAEGMDPQEAYSQVIDGIGDVSELLGHIERVNTFDPVSAEEKRKKRALFTCAGIGLSLAGIAVGIIGDYLGDGELGAILMFLCFAAGVIVLIYGRMTNSVKYEKMDDTLVEDIKMQMTHGKKQNKLFGLASASMWCLLVLVYFTVSMLTVSLWHITWLIFIFGAALQCVMSAYFHPESRAKSLGGAYWCVVVIVYYLLSVLTGKWAITWLLFLLAAAGHLASRFFVAWRGEQ